MSSRSRNLALAYETLCDWPVRAEEKLDRRISINWTREGREAVHLFLDVFCDSSVAAKELQRRGKFVEVETGSGSPYGRAKQKALAAFDELPEFQEQSVGWVVVHHLHLSSVQPRWASAASVVANLGEKVAHVIRANDALRLIVNRKSRFHSRCFGVGHFFRLVVGRADQGRAW